VAERGISDIAQDYQSLLPWEQDNSIKESDISIAVTGKFFNRLLKDSSLLAIK
jgi:hypothetical protein